MVFFVDGGVVNNFDVRQVVMYVLLFVEYAWRGDRVGVKVVWFFYGCYDRVWGDGHVV